MAANTIYISAGLPVAKDSGQSPTSEVNTAYISAGLPPEVESAPSVTLAGTAADSINESDIVTGGETIILTLTNDTWVEN